MRKYNRQFKEDAVKLVIEQKMDPADAARKLGINHGTLGYWLKQRGLNPDVSAPLSGDPRVLAIQIKDLRQQVKRLEMEKEILKKATVFFANQNR
jgi:transposase